MNSLGFKTLTEVIKSNIKFYLYEMLKFEKQLFHFLVLLALSIIIIPKYYITGDGASHVYNAKVLFDYLFGNERDFYKEFYQINRALDPNWMSHLLLGFFLQIFPAWLADKFFQIIYVLTFAYGFRYLIKQINTENTFLSFLFFPFLFTLPFQQGFYNYVLALTLLFWTVAYYIKTKNDFANPLYQLWLCVLLLAMSFTHGMPTIYAMLIISMIWLSDNIKFIVPFYFKKLFTSFSRLLLVFIPTVILIFSFIVKKGLETVPHTWSTTTKWKNFLQFFSSQSTRNIELYPAISVGIVLLTFLIILIFTFRKKASLLRYVFLVMTFYTLYSYITCPHSIGGAGSIDIRLAFLPPMFLLLFFASNYWSNFSKQIFIISSFFISISFLVIRFPYVMKASSIGKEMMTVTPFIKDKSVVLNLHFNDWQALKSGDSLFQKDGSFIHFTDFLGAQKNKHLIMVMNYEAEIYYFPVNWRPIKNPRDVIPNMLPGNYPPKGNYQLYENYTNHAIDYILLQNWNDELQANPTVDSLVKSFNNNFTKVFESEHKYVVVLKKN